MSMYMTSERSYSRISEIDWTGKMKRDLLLIYRESLSEYHSDDPPRYFGSGNVVSVTQLMIRKWEDLGYRHYGLTCQDLQDQSWKLRDSHLITKVSRCKNLFFSELW